MELKTIGTDAKPTTDQGTFEALAAAWTEDREKDIIHRGAFTGTIKAWRRSGKQIPLHWDHKADPHSIIGHVDPMSMRETDQGLFVRGQVDLEGSTLGKDAWRHIKANRVGLSFGYLPVQAAKRAAGGRDLHVLDVFEVSITPAPMHPDTRILSTKGQGAPTGLPDAREQREQAKQAARAVELERVAGVSDPTVQRPAPMQALEERVEAVERAVQPEPEPALPDPASQREHATRLAAAVERERASETVEDVDMTERPVEPKPEPVQREPLPDRTAQRDRARREARDVELERVNNLPEPEEREKPDEPEAPRENLPNPGEQRARARQAALDVELDGVDGGNLPMSFPTVDVMLERLAALEGSVAKALERLERPRLRDPAELRDDALRTAREADLDWLDTLEGKATAAHVSDTPHPEPFSASRTSNWVARAGGLPAYVQNVAHDLLEHGRARDESNAIEMAIGIMKRWCAGEGNVTAATRRKACAAVAQWERMKAETRNKPGKAVVQGTLSDSDPDVMLQTMINQARAFLAAEDDPDDKAAMEDIIAALEDLIAAENSETDGKGLSPDGKAGPGRRPCGCSDGADVTGAHPVDPLRKRANTIVKEALTDDVDLTKSPPPQAPKPKPKYSYEALREKAKDEMLMALIGVEDQEDE